MSVVQPRIVSHEMPAYESRAIMGKEHRLDKDRTAVNGYDTQHQVRLRQGVVDSMNG